MKQLHGVLAAFAVFFCSAASAEDVLDSLAAEILSLEGAPGMAVSVVRPDTAPVMRGYGVRRLGEKQKVDAHTVFGLASATKAFTALSLALLADEGKITWDEPVRSYLPEFRVADAYVSEHATLEDLLAHRTGTSKGDIVWFANPDKHGAALVETFAGLPQEKSFRDGLSYSNLMYAAAGEIVRRASGESWRRFVETRIFSPLRMKDAVADRKALRNNRNVAGLHGYDGAEMKAFARPDVADNTAPAGGIYASAADMTKWLEFWLSCSAGRDAACLTGKHRLGELTGFQTLIFERSPIDDFMHDADAPYGYALGWFVSSWRGRKVLTHLGGGDGVSTLVSWMPDEGVGVAVMMNAEGALGRIAIRNAVFDDALGVSDTDWVSEFSALLAVYRQSLNGTAHSFAEQKSEQKPDAPLAAYAGVYDGGAFGRMKIVHLDEGLRVRIGGLRNYELRHWAGNDFQVMIDNPGFSWPAPSLIRFRLGADGAPEGFSFEAAGQSADYARYAE